MKTSEPAGENENKGTCRKGENENTVNENNSTYRKGKTSV
jgi:hypothetical protein